MIWQCLICQAAGYLSWNRNDRGKRRVGQRYGFHNAGLVNINLQIAQAQAVGVQVKSAKAQQKTCAAPVAVGSWQTASGAVSGIKVQTHREKKGKGPWPAVGSLFSPLGMSPTPSHTMNAAPCRTGVLGVGCPRVPVQQEAQCAQAEQKTSQNGHSLVWQRWSFWGS